MSTQSESVRALVVHPSTPSRAIVEWWNPDGMRLAHVGRECAVWLSYGVGADAPEDVPSIAEAIVDATDEGDGALARRLAGGVVVVLDEEGEGGPFDAS